MLNLLIEDITWSHDRTSASAHFGRAARGERSKTGREQGVIFDEPYSIEILRRRCAGQDPKTRVFKITAQHKNRWWRAAARSVRGDEKLVGPPHTFVTPAPAGTSPSPPATGPSPKFNDEDAGRHPRVCNVMHDRTYGSLSALNNLNTFFDQVKPYSFSVYRGHQRLGKDSASDFEPRVPRGTMPSAGALHRAGS